ncbi:RIF1 [Mytilus edulis]|uniref:RIF1 n=1 Tax=Mytilus edulis TaxID=6550 RepID=A0A8S3TEX5_MYTED|nr:RIF1 [Mytilus edulis]
MFIPGTYVMPMKRNVYSRNVCYVNEVKCLFQERMLWEWSEMFIQGTRNLFTQNHEIFETKRADIQNLLFTNIDVSQDNLEEDHKEEHVLDNEEDIEEVTEEDHVVDHEKDHMEDIEEEHKVFQSALDKLSDEGKRERFLIFFISGRFPLKQHCIRPVFGHC